MRALALVALLAGIAHADPPASLLTGEAKHGAALDPVFVHFKLDKMSCKFSEQKHIALLAKPLTSSGVIYYDRDKGIARTTLAPKKQQVVLTKTTISIRSDKHTEEIPLDKTKDLRAFAMIFPSLLRGDRAELEKAFDIGLYGSDSDWWALSFAPKADTLKKLVRKVVVVGRKGDVVSLQVVEASGDTTDTQLTDVLKNGDVPAAEIATAFGAS
jgi:outer membrane lipoprotein-sorting protein